MSGIFFYLFTHLTISSLEEVAVLCPGQTPHKDVYGLYGQISYNSALERLVGGLCFLWREPGKLFLQVSCLPTANPLRNAV